MKALQRPIRGRPGARLRGHAPRPVIAQAFGGIAERAEKIGELNVSSELLQGLLTHRAYPRSAAVRREKDNAQSR